MHSHSDVFDWHEIDFIDCLCQSRMRFSSFSSLTPFFSPSRSLNFNRSQQRKKNQSYVYFSYSWSKYNLPVFRFFLQKNRFKNEEKKLNFFLRHAIQFDQIKLIERIMMLLKNPTPLSLFEMLLHDAYAHKADRWKFKTEIESTHLNVFVAQNIGGKCQISKRWLVFDTWKNDATFSGCRLISARIDCTRWYRIRLYGVLCATWWWWSLIWCLWCWRSHRAGCCCWNWWWFGEFFNQWISMLNAKREIWKQIQNHYNKKKTNHKLL